MKSRPILFSGAMVRAILDGRKTQTRRIVTHESLITTHADGSPKKAYPNWHAGQVGIRDPGPVHWNIGGHAIKCPYGKPWDRLWVRETHAVFPWSDGKGNDFLNAVYRADNPSTKEFDPSHDKWKPSIFMLREYSRITLEITAIRCERLRDIETKPLDIAAEGQPRDSQLGDIEWYRGLWESINGKASWEANPWVWVVEFRRVEP